MTVHAMIRPLDFSDYSDIPAHTRTSLRNYVEHGLPPGGFLTALLTNDLFGAVGAADVWNAIALTRICEFVYNEIPSECWGSPDKMKSWMNYIREQKQGVNVVT